MKLWWLRFVGRFRLYYGLSPLCKSSPPKSGCFVCDGDYRYGHEASKLQLESWRITYRFEERVMEDLTEKELAPRMAITDDLVKLISEGKARIVDRREGKFVNGRRMVEIDVEILE